MMDSLPKLDTATDTFPPPSKNSYASATDSNPRSARSSYASISDVNSVSTRSSFSSILEYMNRVSSFSRTFIPDSVESTPISSRDSSPDSPTRWVSQDSVMVVDQNSPRAMSQHRPRLYSKVGAKDGPSALKESQNVKNVLCVAFGAFDRYYISWEDNDGAFHQESHKLPDTLYKWLSPPSGETRHLPTLQVSFGSNDDFFASDQDGKLSNRDSSSPADKKAPPRLAEVARGFIKRKTHTVSSPKLLDDLQTKLGENMAMPKLERRKTFMEGQSSDRTESKQTTFPLSLSLHSRRKSRGENPSKEQTSIRLSLSLHSRRESRSEMPKIEERKPVVSTVGQLPPALDAVAELAKAEKRRSFFIAAERQQSPPEMDQEAPVVEQDRNSAPLGQPQLSRLEARPEFKKSEQRRGFLAAVPLVRPSWPERKTLLMNRERILTGRDTAPKPTYVDACVQTELTDAKIYAHLSSISVPIPMPTIPLPPRHSVAIGSMADFFRGQFSLGDALRFV